MAASLSSEAFLPTGAFDKDMTLSFPYQAISSTATPSSSFPPSNNSSHLPPYANHQQSLPLPGHIPPASSFPIPPPAEPVPLSLSSLRAAQSASKTLPSTHLHIDSSSHSKPGNLSPTQRGHLSSPDQAYPPSSASRTSGIPQYLIGASLSRSVSADAAPPTQQTSIYMVQRLVQQNKLIREAWEAERNYLEANRRRAEEVYQEERAIMDDEREAWEAEKISMLQEIGALKERLHRLEGENSTLKSITSQSIQVTGVVSPMGSQRGGSGDMSMESSFFSAAASHLTSRSHAPSVLHSSSTADAASLPPGLDGASRRPHFRASGSSRVSPTTTLTEPSSFLPLDPRTQPENSISKDFLSSPSDDSAKPIPIIDVQEIDPNLEGIPIKATAVRRSTFSVGGDYPENPPSPATSTPPSDAAHYTELSRKFWSVPSAAPSKQHTLQALAAGENKRLTMHAGHTPNHSLSLFSTVAATETCSTVGPSEGATPTAEMTAAAAPIRPEEPAGLDGAASACKLDQGEAFEDDPEPMLDPTDDAPLKGPLMIKNIPAYDEIFWEAVNKKLEPISLGENALPAVVQTPLDDADNIPAAEELGTPEQTPCTGIPTNPVGVDGPSDAHVAAEDDACEPPSRKGPEPDIPLKLKSTSNFGAPFGAM